MFEDKARVLLILPRSSPSARVPARRGPKGRLGAARHGGK